MTVPEMNLADEISLQERNARQILPEIARAHAMTDVTVLILFFTWRDSRSERQQPERNKENKGGDGILSVQGLADWPSQRQAKTCY